MMDYDEGAAGEAESMDEEEESVRSDDKWRLFCCMFVLAWIGPHCACVCSAKRDATRQLFREPPSTKEYQETGYYELVPSA